MRNTATSSRHHFRLIGLVALALFSLLALVCVAQGSGQEFQARNGAVTSMITEGDLVTVCDKKNVTKVSTR